MSRVRFRSRVAFAAGSCLLGGSLLSTVVVGATAASATRISTPSVTPARPAPSTTGARAVGVPETTAPPATDPAPPVSDPFQPVLPPTSAATANVSIVDFGFSPASVTVTAGSTVTWTNTGAAIHSVTSDTGAFDSSPTCPSGSCLDPGATYSHTFATAGRFTYHCRVHPTMTGTVVVNAAPGTTTTTTTAAPGSTAGNPPVSGGGGVSPTTASGSTGPELAFTGASAIEMWLVLSALFTISVGLALRPRRRAFPVPASDRSPHRH